MYVKVRKFQRGQKSYVIFKRGLAICLLLMTRGGGGVGKSPKHDYVIYEWSLMGKLSKQNVSTIKEAIFSYVATLVETKLSHSNFFKFSLQLCALIMNTIGQN